MSTTETKRPLQDVPTEELERKCRAYRTLMDGGLPISPEVKADAEAAAEELWDRRHPRPPMLARDGEQGEEAWLKFVNLYDDALDRKLGLMRQVVDGVPYYIICVYHPDHDNPGGEDEHIVPVAVLLNDPLQERLLADVPNDTEVRSTQVRPGWRGRGGMPQGLADILEGLGADGAIMGVMVSRERRKKNGTPDGGPTGGTYQA